MIPHSADFDEVLVHGVPITAVRGTIFQGNSIVLGPDDFAFIPSPTVTVDETSLSVRTLAAAVADDTGALLPYDQSDPLSIYGNELQLEIGLWIPTLGDFEWVPAGRYSIRANGATTEGVITITGYERSLKIAAAKNEAPWVITGGTTLFDAVNNYAQAKYPGITVVADAAASTLTTGISPIVFQEGTSSGDPWQNMRDLCASFAHYLNVDPVGNLVISAITDPATAPVVWDFIAGEDNLAISGAISGDLSNVHNVWVALGTSYTNHPIRATAEITDVLNPMYAGVGSRVGRIADYIGTGALDTPTKCQAAADAAKAAETGWGQGRSFTAVPHPCHEIRDVVRWKSDLLHIDTRLILSKWTLTADLLAATGYTTRLIA